MECKQPVTRRSCSANDCRSNVLKRLGSGHPQQPGPEKDSQQGATWNKTTLSQLDFLISSWMNLLDDFLHMLWCVLGASPLLKR